MGTITYTANSVVLSNIHPVPEPAAWLLVSGVAVVWIRRRFVMASRSRARVTRTVPLLALAVIMGPAALRSEAQTTATWTGASGNWTNSTLWSTNPNHPNNGSPPGTTYNAIVNGPAPNMLAVDVPITIQQLTMQNGTIGGAGSLTMNAPIAWSGGTFAGSGAVNANGGASISGNTIVDGRTLTLRGSSTLAGTLFVNNGGQLINDAGATLITSSFPTSVQSTLGSGSVLNRGTIRIPGVFSVESITSTGTIEVQSFLGLGPPQSASSSNTLSGPVTLGTGALLVLQGGSLVQGPSQLAVTSSGSISGPGRVSLRANSVAVFDGPFNVSDRVEMNGSNISPQSADFNGPTTMGSVEFDGGRIGGTGPITVLGDFFTRGGAISGSGPLDIQGNMVLNGPTFPYFLTGRTVNLLGPMHTFGSGPNPNGYTYDIGAGGAMAIGPVATAEFGLTFLGFSNSTAGAATVVNAGTIRKTGGVPTVTVGSGVVLDHSGLIDFPFGTLAVAGTLSGTGRVIAPVTMRSGGVLAPGSGGTGFLHMLRQVSMVSGSSFDVELNGPIPGFQQDQLNLASGGLIALNGSSLRALLGYAPSPTDVLTIISGGPVNGTFAGLPNEQRFAVGSFGGVQYYANITYTANSVALSGLSPNPVPEPAVWLLAGGVAAAWAWRKKVTSVRDRRGELAG